MGLYIQEVKRYFGLNNLDEKIEKYCDFDGGYFVELGANNGVNQSNTLYFEKYRNWKGLLVEPILHNYLACRQNRSRKTHSFCNACVSFEYKDKFVEIIYSNLMTISEGLESDIASPKEHASEGKKFLGQFEENVTLGAIARPLNDLLIEAGSPHSIDLLSLDVEGAEIEVLKGINHEIFKFRYMVIESRSFDKLKGYLEINGYQYLDKLSDWDYLFKLAI